MRQCAVVETTVRPDAVPAGEIDLALIDPPQALDVVVWCHEVEVCFASGCVMEKGGINAPWLTPYWIGP